MCLRTITKLPKPTNKVVEVYKAFVVKSWEKRLRFSMRSDCRIKLEPGVWIKAKGSRNIAASQARSYPSGFHAHLTKSSCKRNFGACTILKVKFRKVVAEGLQRGKVLVAKEMFIPKEEFEKACKQPT